MRAIELNDAGIAVHSEEKILAESPGYDLISAVVKTGSRVAIYLSTRL